MLESRLDTKRTRLNTAKGSQWLFCSEQGNNATTLVSLGETRGEGSRLYDAWRNAIYISTEGVGREADSWHCCTGTKWGCKLANRCLGKWTTATPLDLCFSAVGNNQSEILVWKYLRRKLAIWQYLVYWLIILCLKLVQTQLFRLSWRQAEPWMGGATKGGLLLENETPHLSLRTSVCIKGTFVVTFKSLPG